MLAGWELALRHTRCGNVMHSRQQLKHSGLMHAHGDVCVQSVPGGLCIYIRAPLPPEKVNRLHHTMQRCPGAAAMHHIRSEM